MITDAEIIEALRRENATLRRGSMLLREQRDNARNLCRIQRRLICDLERERHDAMCRVKELEKDLAEGISCD